MTGKPTGRSGSSAEEPSRPARHEAAIPAAAGATADLLGKGAGLLHRAAREGVTSVRLSAYAWHRLVEGDIAPAAEAAIAMGERTTGDLLDAMRGLKAPADVARDQMDRLRAGLRYGHLVTTWGRELFGSARFRGETVLAEHGPYRVSFIPPSDGAGRAPFAMFHGAGAIPYGDALFRLLPEANFFQHFVAAGVPLYVMELKGDRGVADASRVTVDSLFDAYSALTAAAFEHCGREKLVLEGYCGHGTQALAWVSARPAEADERFKGLALFVSPVDGRECELVGGLSRVTNDSLNDAMLLASEAAGGYVSGVGMQTGLDLALGSLFVKTPFGRFSAGWGQPKWAEPKSPADLTPDQRRELVGAWWVSPENADRYPISTGLVRFENAVFKKGVSANGDLPWSSAGSTLSLRDVARRTSLRVAGIFGGRDVVVPDRTAYVLKTLLGDRYRHVVHPNAAHVSYIFMPAQWDRSSPWRFDPSPLDVIASI